MIKTTIHLLLLFLLTSCFLNKNLVPPPSPEEYYYDESRFALIKFDKRDSLLTGTYLNWTKNDSNKPYDFFTKSILKTNDLNPGLSKKDYKEIKKPEMVERPDVDYPLDAPIIGGFLTVVITISIDTNGYVEFAELYNIYRDAQTNSEKDKDLLKNGTNPWTQNKIDYFDIAFIKLSLFESLKIKFIPATFKGKPIRVKMRVPYQYIVGKEYDKRKL